MRTTKLSTKRVLGLFLAGALALSGTVALASSSEAAVGSYTSSPKTGKVTAGAVLTVTGTGFQTAAGASTLFAAATGVQFTAGTCPTTHAVATTTVLDSGGRSVVSAKKLVVTAPVLSLTALKATAWKICVYGTANSNALLGTATYTVYPIAAITAANSPASGPAAGGSVVIVSGTDFTAGSTVKFGTVAATKVSVAADGLSLTATAPAQAASATPVNVVVTTLAGLNTTSSTFAQFTYVDAIKSVSPSHGTAGAVHTIEVTGTGFTAITAANVSLSTTDLAGAGVPIACANIQIVSATSLTCDLPSTVTAGAYLVIVHNDATGTVYESVVSSGASYLAGAF